MNKTLATSIILLNFLFVGTAIANNNDHKESVLAYIYEDLLKDCKSDHKSESDVCWNVIASVISSQDTWDEKTTKMFCLEWSLEYSHGKKMDAWIKETIIKQIISFAEKVRSNRREGPDPHPPTAAQIIVWSLSENYPCDGEK